MVVAALAAGRWVGRAGSRLPMPTGCLLAGAGVILTDAALRGFLDFIVLAATLALAGLGFGIIVVPVTAVALAVIPPEDSGMAASATTTSRGSAPSWASPCSARSSTATSPAALPTA